MKLILYSLTVIAATTLACGLFTQNTPTPPPQLGLNFIHFFEEDAAHFQPDAIFQDFDALGLQSFRQLARADLLWCNVEFRNDRWDFERTDAVIFDATLPPIVTLFSYQYASPTPPWCTNSADFQKTLGAEAQDYLEHVIARYGPYVKYWEIGNEMDHWRAADPGDDHAAKMPDCYPSEGFSPQEQGIFLAQVAAFIRERDPDAVIIMPGMGGISDYTLNTWFAGVLEGGGADWFDVVNYHYYGGWQPYPHLRAQLETFLNDHGLEGKPIWLTETGTTSSATLTLRTNYPNNPETQAADVFRRVVQAWGAGDQFVSWHTYIDTADTPQNAWRGYGILTPEGQPKPAYFAYELLARELVPYAQVIPLSTDPRHLNVYQVTTTEGAVKYVAWGSGEFIVPAGIAQMTLVLPDADSHFDWQAITPGQSVDLSPVPVLLK